MKSLILTVCLIVLTIAFFEIDAQSGNVGIGVSAPGSLLHLYSTSNSSRGISIGAQGTQSSQQAYLELITLGDGTAKLGDPGNKGWHFTGRGAAYVGIDQQNDLAIANWNGSNWDNIMFLETTGNVGLGTSSPLAKLHIEDGNLKMTNPSRPWLIFDHLAGDLNGGIQWWQDSLVEMELFYDDINESLRLWDTPGGVPRVVIERTGNVGIGTTAPTSALEVNGQFELGSGLYSKIISNNDVSQIGLFSSFTPYKGAYILANSAGHFDAPGTINFTHGDYTAAAPASTIRFRYANDGTITNQLTINSTGNIGIGTSDPDWPLHVTTNSSSNLSKSIYAINTSTTGTGQQITGIFGEVRITTMVNPGAGIYGYHNSASGTSAGVRGESSSLTGRGVYARASHGTGTNFALYARTVSPNGFAGYFVGGKNYFQGFVGIGTETPTERLQVEGNIEIDQRIIANDGGGLEFTTDDDVIRLKIHDNGNVGIGTTSPSNKLNISGGDLEINDNAPWVYLDNTGTGNSGIYFQNTGTTGAQVYYNGNGDYLYMQNSTSNDFIAIDNGGIGLNTTTPAYDLQFVGNNGGDIAEFYNSNTASSADVLRTKVNRVTPGAGQYYVRCVDGSGGTDGGVVASGAGGVVFATASDRRLKMNIKDFSGALELLNQTQPRQYEFRSLPGIKHYGFIAQELKSVYPIAVVGEENSNPEIEPMMIDYSMLTPLLAGATKEMYQKIKNQQIEINELQKQLEEIKRLLEM